MFTKTLAATATAALIAAGSLGATTTTASAHYHGHSGIYFGGSGFGIGIGVPGYVDYSGLQKVCEPVFQTKKVWDAYYGWTYTKVFVGKECHYVSSYPYAW